MIFRFCEQFLIHLEHRKGESTPYQTYFLCSQKSPIVLEEVNLARGDDSAL